MKNTMSKMKPFLVGCFVLIFTVACAKKKGYEEVYKQPELVRKELAAKAGQDNPHLYLVSTLGAPREVTAALPFFQGDEKIVYFKWEEDGLKVYQKDDDPRFADNPANDKPVLSIPGEYRAYRCTTDDAGKCTNKEEENTELEWFQKPFFFPDFKSMSQNEVNGLTLFNLDGCHSEIPGETKIKNYEMKPGVLNIEVEKTYTTNLSAQCINQLYYSDSLPNATFKVSYFFSVVELSQLASPDYEVVYMPDYDKNKFGFFRAEREVLNNVFDPTRKKVVQMLERFNPKKKVIDYHLSFTYNKPENLYLKEATYKAVDRMNKLMDEGGVGIQIKLHDAPSLEGEKKSGDLRYNTIVLIDEPLSNGLLGYGPSVSNPYTGEIVQAHTNMYSGVLKTGVRRSYTAMVQLSKEQKAAGGTESDEDFFEEDHGHGHDHDHHGHDHFGEEVIDLASFKAPRKAHMSELKLNVPLSDEIVAPLAQREELVTRFTEAMANREFPTGYKEKTLGKLLSQQELKEMYKDAVKENNFDKQLRIMSENNMYHIENFSFSSLAKTIMPGIKEIEGILNADGTLKVWEALNEEQQSKVERIVMVNTYTATFVHELGHNLGLRHNFEGSTDEDNFYSKEEADALGFPQIPSYSSIMDYAFSDLNELSTFGKYDIAALRFGYQREVEIELHEFETASTGIIMRDEPVASEFVKINTTLLEELGTHQTATATKTGADGGEITYKRRLRPYEFCTDENVGGAPTCNRFDEGTNAAEIASHYVKRYEDRYYLSNFRNGRTEFDLIDSVYYIPSTDRALNGLRRILEMRELYVDLLNPLTNNSGDQFMTQGCSDDQVKRITFCKDINEIRDAVKISADQFLKILKTPDHTCALVSEVDDPATRVDDTKVPSKLVKLGEFFDDNKFQYDFTSIPRSCFEPKVVRAIESENAGFKVFAEAGKYFRDLVLPGRTTGDIDVIGTWPDKALAMKYLTQRYYRMGLTDDFQTSFADIDRVKNEIENVLLHMAGVSDLENGVPFRTRSGAEISVDYSLDLDYLIPDQFIWLPRVMFDLPRNSSTRLAQVIFNDANAFNFTREPTVREQVRDFRNFVTVFRSHVTGGFINDDNTFGENALRYEGEDYVYIAPEQNKLAHSMITLVNALEDFKEVENASILSIFRARDLSVGLDEKQAAVYRFTGGNKEQMLFIRQQLVSLSITDPMDPRVPATLRIFVELHNEDDGLQKLVDLLTEREAGLAAMKAAATDEEKKIFDAPLEMVVDYLLGKLEAKAQNVEKAIELLPTRRAVQ